MKFIKVNLNSEQYCEILSGVVIPFAEGLYSGQWGFNKIMPLCMCLTTIVMHTYQLFQLFDKNGQSTLNIFNSGLQRHSEYFKLVQAIYNSYV